MNMVDIEMATKFSRILNMVDENGEVYIPPTLYVGCRIVPTQWWAIHFGFQHTKRLNYWKLVDSN